MSQSSDRNKQSQKSSAKGMKKGEGAKKKRNNPFRGIVSALSWISVMMLWACIGTTYLNPSTTTGYASVPGLAFPFCLAFVVAMLAVSLLLARHRAWITLLGLLSCVGYIRTYCPINVASPAPKGSLLVMTYNTMAFGGMKQGEDGLNRVAKYIARSKADIVCFQEGTPYYDSIIPLTKKHTPYFDTVRIGTSYIGCFSIYPIVKTELICKTQVNGAAAFYLLRSLKDTMIVVNNHLESMRLTQEDRNTFHTMVKDPEDSPLEDGSKMLISKIASAGAIRARQADSVAAFIARNKGRNMIVCGDFNDSPISYTRQTIAGNSLIDAYRSTANGIGRTFNKDAIYVRIDHIFCSEQWKPFACKVHTDISLSDHYPMTVYLKYRAVGE